MVGVVMACAHYSSWTSFTTPVHPSLLRMTQGRLPAHIGLLRASVSLLCILKPSFGIWSIAINMTLLRLAGKVAPQLVREEAVSHLQPLHLSLEFRHGAEAIVHTVHCYVSHHASSTHRLIAPVHLSNAFNHVS